MEKFIEAVYTLRNETMKLHPKASVKSIKLDEITVSMLDAYYHKMKYGDIYPPIYADLGERKLFDIDIIIIERFDK